MANSFPYCTLDDVKAVLLGLDVSDIPDTLETRITDNFIPWAQRDVDKWAGTNFDATVTETFMSGSGSDTLFITHRPIREILNVNLYIIPSAQWFQFKRWFYLNNVDQLGTKISTRGGTEPKTSSDLPPYNFDATAHPGFTNTVPSGSETADFNNNETQYGKSDLFIDTKLGKLVIPPRILFLESQAVPFWNYTWLRGVGNVQVQYVYGYSDPTQPDYLIDPTGNTNGNLPKEVTQACANLAAIHVLKSKGIFMSSGAKSVSIDGVSKQYGEVPYEGMIKALENEARELLKPYKRLNV